MPYAPGEYEAIHDKPLCTAKIHPVLSTFVQRLIEAILLPKLCKLYSMYNFFFVL